MPSCQDVERRTTDLLEGDLSLLDRLRLWMHLLTCAPCRRQVRQMEIARWALRDLARRRENAPSTNPEILKLYREWRAGR
ncbi:MAG: zf-HC2 domain-containing protein [Vicinamibacterales bacterium]|nr:zf-HC2 domain-containing protein [Vicinamibacterales bacterium]